MKSKIIDITFCTNKNCFDIETTNDHYQIAYEDYERLQLFVGMEISSDIMVELENNRQLNRAKSVAIKFLSYRPRATKEIVDRLRRDNYEESIIEKTVYDLEKQDMIDDHEFAKIYYDDKIRLNRWSTKKINFELSKKGISGKIIEQLMSEYQKYDYDNAMNLVEYKIDSWKVKYKDPYRLKNKIYSFLSSRGYEYSIIKIITEEII